MLVYGFLAPRPILDSAQRRRGGLAGANWRLGTPFVRVSAAHGKARDAARSGVVDASGTIEAARVAARLLA